MKRLFIFTLLALYSLSASGAAFHMHFCGGHLINVSVFDESTEGCCKGKKHHETNNGFTLSKKCCANNVASLKVEDEHLVKNAFPGIAFPLISAPGSITYNFTIPSPDSFVVPSWHSPPERQCCEVYLVNCNFRI